MAELIPGVDYFARPMTTRRSICDGCQRPFYHIEVDECGLPTGGVFCRKCQFQGQEWQIGKHGEVYRLQATLGEHLRK